MLYRESQIAIYKANQKRTGSAAQFKISKEKKCMFLEMAKQNDEKSFNWEEKVVTKLDEADISKILSLLNNTWPEPQKQGDPDLKLFHQNTKGNKAISLARQTNPKYPGYYMTVSVSEEGKRDRISIPISVDEAEYLKVGLARALEIILGW